ncbi:N-acetylmuramoyl-L-alanine amidase CwlD [Clostridium formicaceticum]|uniref:Germination-specific N-acetylmuramoyl-L-alanine amidase n=1 Tax=Clostridium formicaceticum TaxID=1497 RepID=A0AAC9WJV7_9CLOT|nr:N-acetylmuramoyl-L-alanine amidase CwlD [Clostridium formicaceticum]AOY75066.1 N-acetylmuramoyl-L-alanine amidase CwlD [Clostridium formicaceticum]ARE89490.1 Germination-specific N-acetylmuramoyl-L-alanine amidase precursor [Clostridium formicaceticum]
MKVIIIRKRWIYISIVLLFISALSIACINYCKIKAVFHTLPTLTKVVLLDAGHGGVDPGAVSKGGVKEKDINLAIALYLKEYLEQSGAVVVMTRTKDEGLYSEGGSLREKKNEDLRKRKEMVKESGPDIFITIHLNSFPQTQYHGAQTFYPKDNTKGKVLAEKIQEELINTLDKNNKRVALPKEDVYIIKGLDIPTTLVECGFLSNPKEEQLLQKSSYQKQIAWGIYMGIQRYFLEKP